MSIANIWWIPPHVQSINLSFDGFKENESIAFVSPMILSGGIFSWELPVINGTTMPELVNNIVSSHFKIDIMDIYFEYFLTFIVKYRFITNITTRVHSSWVLFLSLSFLLILMSFLMILVSFLMTLVSFLMILVSFLMILILIKFSAVSSCIQIILMFICLVIIPHRMFGHRWLPTILLNILLLDGRHVILMVLVIIWRMIPLVLHSYLLMMHGWPVTSILSHFLVMILSRSISTILTLHRRFSIMVIWMHIIGDIPNWVIIIRHLSLIWLMVIWPVVSHFALIRVMVVHLTLCK